MNASSGAAGTKPDGQDSQRTSRWWLWGPVLLLTLLAGGLLGLKSSSTGKRAELGAGYIAHVVCSCRYVGNRDMASCRTDFEAGAEIVNVQDYAERKTVIASVPFLARRSARYDPVYGCQLDPP